MNRIKLLFCLAVILVSATGCPSGGPEVPEGKIPVLVSIEPMAFLLGSIGGDRVHIEVLVPAGTEPETYSPDPGRIAAMAKCRVFFRSGFPSEQTLVPKLSSIAPKLEIVDLRKGVDLLKMEHHSHGDGSDDHGDCEDDPHLWMSPSLMKQVALTIRDKMIELDPEGEREYRANTEKLLGSLEEVRLKISEILAPHKGETIYVFHPAYGYFCNEFGLKQKAIEMEGRSPAPQDLAKWIKEAREEKVRRIFVQPEFNRATADAIAKEIGGKVVVHSTLGRDYLENILALAELIGDIEGDPANKR